MINIIHCRFKRVESSEWERGYIITTDYDGSEGPGYIICEDKTIYQPDIEPIVWDLKIEHHYGHYVLNFD